jgi:hypothetical protein
MLAAMALIKLPIIIPVHPGDRVCQRRRLLLLLPRVLHLCPNLTIPSAPKYVKKANRASKMLLLRLTSEFGLSMFLQVDHEINGLIDVAT